MAISLSGRGIFRKGRRRAERIQSFSHRQLKWRAVTILVGRNFSKRNIDAVGLSF